MMMMSRYDCEYYHIFHDFYLKSVMMDQEGS